MLSKRAGGAVLLALGLLSLVWLLVYSPTPQPTASETGTRWDVVWAQSVEVGGQSAAWMVMDGQMADAHAWRAHLVLTPQPMPHRVVLLEGPWSGASNFETFAQELHAALRPAGWLLERKKISDWAPSTQEAGGASGGRILILPSGAWPGEWLRNWEAHVGSNDIVAYFGVRQNVTLDETGAVSDQTLPAWLQAEGQPLDARLRDSARLQGPGGQAVWRIPHTLDEFSDPARLARELVDQMVEPAQENRWAEQTVDWSGGRQSIVALRPAEAQDGWGRVVLRTGEGKLRALRDISLPINLGVLDGPAQAQSGPASSFQLRLRPRYLQAENVSYELRIYDARGALWGQRALGGGLVGQPGASGTLGGGVGQGGGLVGQPGASGTLGGGVEQGGGGVGQPEASGNEKPAGDGSAHRSNFSNASVMWVGSFVQSEWPSGDIHLEVGDQFGRIYAHALVHVPVLEAKALDGEGFIRRFLLLQDGAPVNISSLRVWRDNSSHVLELPVSEGVVSVASSWSEGPHTLHFDLDGASAQYQWVESEGGSWSVLWRWGLPGLLLSLALYALVRPRGRPAWKLVVPEFADWQPQKKEMGVEEMMEVVKKVGREMGHAKTQASAASSIPVRSGDIAAYLQQKGAGRAPLLVTIESVEEILHQLVEREKLVRWNEHYLPASRGVDLATVRRRALVRMLKDRLLENGIKSRNTGAGQWVEDGTGRRFAVWEEKRMHQMDGLGAKAGPTHLVFADEDEQRKFQEALQSSLARETAKVRLRLQTGRLKLVLVDQPTA